MFVFVYVCMFVSITTSDVMYVVCNDPYGWLNKFCSFYKAAVVDIISRCGLSIDAHHKNPPNKSV